MTQNSLKMAWRGLLKNRLFTGLNVFGLAIGLAVALALLLFATDELAFDRFHRYADRIYRINLNVTFDKEQEQWASAPNIIGPTMRSQLPAIESQVRLLLHNFGQTAFVNSPTQKLTETKLFWADSTLFQVFDLPLRLGDPATALNAPNQILLSESAARRYFGTENPVGKTLSVDNTMQLQVTGVFADLPRNSSLDANMIGSFSTIKWASNPTNLSWSNASFETFVRLRPGTNVAQLEQQMEAIVAKNVAKADRFYVLWLQAMPDVHLHSALIKNTYLTRLGDHRQVTILLMLATVVLVIACINYMNLATAQAQTRAKEVGIAKTIGATRWQLIWRFYLETALVTLAALGLSLLLLLVGLPFFNQLANKQLAWQSLLTPPMLVSLGALGVVITALAGAYPAGQLSAFAPKSLLSTTFRPASGANWLRQGLVVTQFTASLVLIMGTLLFYRQLRYIQQQKLGYKPQQVVMLTTAGAEKKEQIDGLKDGLRQLSSVIDVARGQTYPGKTGSGRTIMKPGGKSTDVISITTNRVDAQALNVLTLRLLAGRTLPASKAEGDTTVQVVLNKTAVDFLGYTPQQAIGKIAPNLFQNQAEIVGVVEDFHYESLHQPIGAYAFHNANTESRPYLLVKLTSQNMLTSLRQIEQVFRQYLPNSAFEVQFLDQHLSSLYASEQRTAQVVLVFASLAILVACLGLFGLVAFTAEQRTREIGVRKVLGASVASIVTLLSKDLLKLVLLAIVIASPLAYWLMQGWLANFAYRIQIEWWLFVLAGGFAIAIALLTVSYQSIKSALVNPVKSLRAE